MMIQTILALLVVFVGTTHEIETFCDTTQNVSCYGTVGQPLHLQLITKENAQKMHQKYELNLRRNYSRIQFKKNSTSRTQPRWSFFFTNGTMIINPVETTDFGAYGVEIYLTNGSFMESNNMGFVIKETPTTTTTRVPSTPMTTLTTTPHLQSDIQTLSNEQQKIYYIIMVVSGSFGVFLCLTVTGGLFLICRGRKNCCRTV